MKMKSSLSRKENQMRIRFSRVLTIILAGMLVFGAALPPGTPAAGSGTEADPWVLPRSETVKLICDPYENIAIATATVEIVPVSASGAPSGEPKTIHREIHAKPGESIVAPLWADIEGISDGRYKLKVKVVSEALVESDWTPWYWMIKDWRKPEAPGGCALLR